MPFVKKAANASTKTIKRYYSWAGGLRNNKARLGAQFAPLLLLLSILSASIVGGESSQNAIEPQPKRIETASVEEIEKPIATEVKAPSAIYPITAVKTGLDFQYTYGGELKVYPDKTVIEATWTPACGDSSPVDYQTQKFTYTFTSGNSQMETRNEYSDCFGNEGVSSESDPYRVDPDGTIRVDLIEPSDGSLIREDFIVITGGPDPVGKTVSQSNVKATDKGSPDTLYTSEPEIETPIEETVEEEVYVEQTAPAVYYSTCKEYNDAGLGNFTPDDPEYTSKRDRDSDGIACEF